MCCKFHLSAQLSPGLNEVQKANWDAATVAISNLNAAIARILDEKTHKYTKVSTGIELIAPWSWELPGVMPGILWTKITTYNVGILITFLGHKNLYL